MATLERETKEVAKAIDEAAKRANTALDAMQKKFNQLSRKNDAYKKKSTEDTKLMKKYITEARERALGHSDKVEHKTIRMPQDVGFEDFCMNGYIGSIIQTINAFTTAVSGLRPTADTIKDVHKAYTTSPEFLELTSQLTQEPQRGEKPSIMDGTIGYFNAQVEINYSGEVAEDTTYRLKYRYKKNNGGYSNFKTTGDISKDSGQGDLSLLVPGSAYEVFAQVSKGGIYGDMSLKPATFVTKPLDPPKNFRIKTQGFVDLTLEWDPIEVPAGTGFGVIYKVSIKNKESNEAPREVKTQSANDTEIRIDKLIPGFEYEMCIATGADGKELPFGQPSNNISGRTKPIDPPKSIEAEPYCDGILLTWEDKRKEISSDEVNVFYNLQARVKDDGNPDDEEDDPTFMEICKVFCPRYVCKGLEKGVEYEFRVRSGVESTGVDPIPGKYVSDKRKQATSTVGQAGSHTWCCCVCGEELHAEKKKALPKRDKVGFVWYCTHVKKEKNYYYCYFIFTISFFLIV